MITNANQNSKLRTAKLSVPKTTKACNAPVETIRITASAVDLELNGRYISGIKKGMDFLTGNNLIYENIRRQFPHRIKHTDDGFEN